MWIFMSSYAVLFTALLISQVLAQSCSVGWKNRPGSSDCYRLDTTAKVFQDASSSCAALSSSSGISRLLEPQNADESQFVQNNILNETTDFVWLGLTEVRGPWEIIDGSSVIYYLQNQGCFTDSAATKSSLAAFNTTNSTISCISYCGGRNYKLAGYVSATSECGCANSISNILGDGVPPVATCPAGRQMFYVSGTVPNFWASGQPNHLGVYQGCISMKWLSNFKFNDESCFKKQLYMCKLAANSESSCFSASGVWLNASQICVKPYTDTGNLQNWFQARYACQQAGASLLSVNSTVLFQELASNPTILNLKNLTSQKDFWISGVSGVWSWGSQTPVGYTNWFATATQTINPGYDNWIYAGHCAKLSKGGWWEIESCNASAYTVCKYTIASGTSTTSTTTSTASTTTTTTTTTRPSTDRTSATPSSTTTTSTPSTFSSTTPKSSTGPSGVTSATSSSTTTATTTSTTTTITSSPTSQISTATTTTTTTTKPTTTTTTAATTTSGPERIRFYIIITNIFTSDLENSSSIQYQLLALNVTQLIKNSLSGTFNESFYNVTVVEFRRGSVVAILDLYMTTDVSDSALLANIQAGYNRQTNPPLVIHNSTTDIGLGDYVKRPPQDRTTGEDGFNSGIIIAIICCGVVLVVTTIKLIIYAVLSRRKSAGYAGSYIDGYDVARTGSFRSNASSGSRPKSAMYQDNADEKTNATEEITMERDTFEY